MIFKKVLVRFPTAPKPLVISLKFLISALLMDLVRIAAGMIIITKMIKPIISSIQLEKFFSETTPKVAKPAIADEISILTDDAQSTVTP